MSPFSDRERKTQDRVIRFFRNRLGWEYLGNWADRENSNVEEEYLSAWLKKRYPEALVTRAIHQLQRTASDQSRELYDVNKDVYRLLRYGVNVSEGLGSLKEHVQLIDWEHPQRNHFGMAEEVTVEGEHKKRPDLVLYVNGIALGVIELKRGTVNVAEGIRQNLDNQQSRFIQRFFTTMQLVIAGNDSQGARYGTILTPEKYYQQWKEQGDRGEYRALLDKHLFQLCTKERFLNIINDFILFDAGTKKVCRPHQYFGVQAAQQRMANGEGGIIWHSQGSGKSLTMVWLAQWICEHVDDSRVVVITDRDELDKQIRDVFTDAGKAMERATSGADLVQLLGRADKPLICALVHKFGYSDKSLEEGYEKYVKDIRKNLPESFQAKGSIHVFVDECHRTQSGKFHRSMKAILPKDAVFIGFTGTPLLKKDKQTSLEVFGSYIHTYKFNEAVDDGVVLDLRYEGRNIDQRVTSPDRVDEWFERSTRGLSDLAKAQLKQRWGTLQKLYSSEDRLKKIVADILFDFRVKPRLATGQGNAMLVAGSVYQACKLYELFQAAGFRECAIVTSYVPSVAKVKGEATGSGRETEELEKYKVYQGMLGNESPEAFEDRVKKLFTTEPARMKLLIVVDKLLTGFDAPPATYLYIDKKIQDHGMFQAICRVNRLDDDSKEFGYIVDYKQQFASVGGAIQTYTSDAFGGYDKEDVDGLLKDRLKMARERLDSALEAVFALCEPVHPKEQAHFIRHFCGETEDPRALKETEKNRLALYKLTAELIRAYAAIANEMEDAGYGVTEAEQVSAQVKEYTALRDFIKLAAGEAIDMKTYEADMRQLIDMWVAADPSRKISAFDEVSLLDLLVEDGPAATDQLPDDLRNDHEAVAEIIENNMRKVIIEERPTNPKYYDKMSELLEELIRKHREGVLKYEEYLKEQAELARKLARPDASEYPVRVDTRGKRAVYDFLDRDEAMALEVNDAILRTRQDGWRGNRLKTRALKNAVKHVITTKGSGKNVDLEAFFELIDRQDEY